MQGSGALLSSNLEEALYKSRGVAREVQAAPGAVVGGRQNRIMQCIRVGLSFTKFASEVRKNQLYCRSYRLRQILIATTFFIG